MAKFGKIECLNVCDNYSDHLVGNVYVKFGTEQEALDAMTALQNRYYNGKQILAEFSPVADFREATCRQYEENSCQRGGFCNFMHLKPISRCAPGPDKGRVTGKRHDCQCQACVLIINRPSVLQSLTIVTMEVPWHLARAVNCSLSPLVLDRCLMATPVLIHV
jgi:hypothetical protein